MSLDSLTQAVSKAGDLCRKPCPAHTDHLRQDDTAGRTEPCPTCGGTGKVWDDQNPIVQALWRWNERFGGRFVRRPSEQAALRLLEAVKQVGLWVQLWNTKEGWRAWIHETRTAPYTGEEGPNFFASNWPDAVAAALLAWMDAQEVT